jgi:excisionase family DNA binding protein
MASARSPDLRRIRPTTTYSPVEIAVLFSIHRNTVLRWIKGGLQPLDDGRPLLIHGSELKRYLKQRIGKRKQKCAPDELPCFRCRAPRKPIKGTIGIARQNAQTLTLTAICATCGSQMFRAGNAAKLRQYEESFGLIMTPKARISGQGIPLVNGDRSKERQREELQPAK